MRVVLTLAAILVWCPRIHAEPSARSEQRCAIVERVVTRMTEMVETAERLHLTASDSLLPAGPDVERWMHIEVDRCPVAEVLDLRIHVAHNALWNPGTPYVLALDGGDAVFPISGFGALGYAPVMQRSLARIGRVTDEAPQAVTRTYFEAVENWSRESWRVVIPPCFRATSPRPSASPSRARRRGACPRSRRTERPRAHA